MKNTQERFDALAERLRQFEPSPFPGPVSAELIADAEAELAVIFPQSYTLFLQIFGAGDFPFDIYGIAPTDLPEKSPGENFWSFGDVVGMTQSEREEVEPKLPHALVAFQPNGMGDHWCLDTGNLTDGECPVVFWNHENGESQTPNQTHATFLDWLEDVLDEGSIQEYFADKSNFSQSTPN